LSIYLSHDFHFDFMARRHYTFFVFLQTAIGEFDESEIVEAGFQRRKKPKGRIGNGKTPIAPEWILDLR